MRDASHETAEPAASGTAASPSPVLARARQALHDLFGFADFRPAQEPFIEAILRNENVLVVMPTGAGKSLLYQLPALARRGLTVVVSPLKSLMKDQVDKLRAAGLGQFVELINSEQTHDQQQDVIARIRAQNDPDGGGDLRLLYVAPERFGSRSFMDALHGLPDGVRMLAVDEAHCISQWGHDFRPHYARLRKVCEQLQPRQVIGLTATATPQVQEDIRDQLGQDLRIEVHGFRRDNLHLNVVKAARKRDKLRVIDDTYRAMGRFGIVYCATRPNVERTYEALCEMGLKAGCYHGGMDDAQRVREQERFHTGEVDIIVATNAFGLGVDKPDVRFIVHYDIPGTVEAYYQEAGRAGRDGKPSRCVLLYSMRDLDIQRLFLESDNPTEQAFREVWGKLLATPGEVIEQTRAEMAEGLEHARDSHIVSTIIKRLDEAGFVQRMSEHRARAAFKLVGHGRFQAGSQRAALYRYLDAQPESRTVGISVDLAEVSEATGIPANKLAGVIRALEDKGVLHYEPPFRGRALRLLDRSAPEELALDWTFLKTKRDAAFGKLDLMVAYAETDECRHRYLLKYFGDPEANDCGTQCDACERGPRTASARQRTAASGGVRGELPPAAVEAAFDILSLAKRLRGVFGSRRLTQVLQGSRDAKVQEWNLDRHEEYGKYAGFTGDTLNAAVDSLLAAGLLEMYRKNTEDKFKRCRISERGEECLARRDADMLPRVDELAVLAGTNAAPADEDAEEELNAADQRLYDALADLRATRTTDEGLPPYAMASNRTLQTIAVARPRTLDDLQAIHGMGPHKVKTYGDSILRVVKNHASAGGPTVVDDPPVRRRADTNGSGPARPAAHAPRGEGVGASDAAPSPAVAARFDALSRWRADEARRLDVPPYEVAWDGLLRAIAEHNPLSLAALRAVEGVNAEWHFSYGRDIVACLRLCRAATE